MTTEKTYRPEASEYNPYFERYISLVPDGDLLTILREQLKRTLATFASISDAQAATRYAEGKWSVKELVGHMIDSERIFAYRALRFARGDTTPLPGYEQDDYIRNASFDACSFESLASEFESVRRATIFLFKHLDAEAWTRTGKANDSAVSVRALGYMIAGHELHHTEILRTRYLSS